MDQLQEPPFGCGASPLLKKRTFKQEILPVHPSATRRSASLSPFNLALPYAAALIRVSNFAESYREQPPTPQTLCSAAPELR